MKRALLVAAVALFVSSFAYGQDCSLMTNITESVPDGFVGQPYNFQIEFIGGTEPYTFEIIDGELPAGLKLTPRGRIHGRPEVEADNSVLFLVTDSQGCTLGITYPIRVNP